MTEKKYRNRETLKELYWNQGLSTTEVAEKLDCGAKTVQRWLHKFDLGTRTATQDKPPSLYLDQDGYRRIAHRDGSGEQKHFLIHRLVAVAEHGIEEVKGKDVHHRNGFRLDNRPSNLEPMSKSNHAKEHKLGGNKLESWNHVQRDKQTGKILSNNE